MNTLMILYILVAPFVVLFVFVVYQIWKWRKRKSSFNAFPKVSPERRFDKSPKHIVGRGKGETAEISVHNELIKLPSEYNVISDVLLFDELDRSTQIDHIVTSPYGVFVIETKSWKGEITGDERGEYWTRDLGGSCERFYNPIRQNEGHVKFLEDLFSYKYVEVPIIPIVVFEDNAALYVRGDTHIVINRRFLLGTIRRYNKRVISDWSKNKVEEAIEENAKAGKKAEERHIKNVKIIQLRKKIERTERCPLCGSDLEWVVTSSYSYYGKCSDPHCKFDSRTSLEEIASKELAQASNPTLDDALRSARTSEGFERNKYPAFKDGADVEARDGGGRTALMWAVWEGRLDVARLLIEYGADVNARDNDGRTALMVVAIWGNLGVAKFLIAYGADVEAKDTFGNTALMWFTKHGKLDVVRLLMEHGADVNARDNDGWTALIVAAREDKLEIARYLIAQGADVNARDKEGKTALRYARREMARLLRAHGAWR